MSLYDIFFYNPQCYSGRESIRFAIIAIMLFVSGTILIVLKLRLETGNKDCKAIASVYNIFWVSIVCTINSALLMLIKYYISILFIPLVIFLFEKLNMIEIKATEKAKPNLAELMMCDFMSKKWEIRLSQIIIPLVITFIVNIFNIY